MFTQCPDCQTTFRVSTEVLQQAEGRVRCGGCGNAFDALEYMSKDESSQAAPEGRASKESTSDQNKQLLETLDKLAGPEVELEDTGVEWRVLEKPDDGKTDSDATGSLRFVVEGDSEEADSEAVAVHGRQGDLPQPVPDAQESLDLPETEQPQANPGERRYDDNTILPADFGDEDDLDELPFLQAETPKRRASDREAIEDTPEFDAAQVDLALGEPDEWVDLLDEMGDEDADADVAAEASVDDDTSSADDAAPKAVEGEPAADEPPGEDMPSDIDTQFLLQAEEMGLDTGSHQIVKDEEDEAGDISNAPVDAMSDEVDDDVAAEAEDAEAEEPDETDIEDVSADEDEEDEEADIEEELSLEEDAEEDDVEDLESTGEFKAKIAIAEKALAGEDEDQSDITDEEIEELAELDIEEEMAASDKEDEAAATEDSEDAIASAIRSGKDFTKLFDEDSPMVETIIMEGEMIGDSINKERRMTAQASGTFENPGPLEDTYSLNRGKVRGGRRASDPAGYTVIASVIVLGLLLLGQIMHQSRQSLAKYGAFNRTIGSIYRVLGKPVTPEWDIRGWRFEATNGNVDEDEDLLTIYSRIANKSSQALPYPLVHISLTDRWEDVIGSRVLEPNEYLAGDLDPRRPVPSGENFTAVITIESPSVEATGFRLTACYRIAPGRVRCADEHFKD